jgi:tetratricopeptide (TPR) repeat protein
MILARLFRVLLAATAGGVLGVGLGVLILYWWPLPEETDPLIRRLPYPYVVPTSPNNISLRFAMVHDVLTERFARHGVAYYKERNRRTREAMDKFKSHPASQPTEEYFALVDDLGVGLDQAGDYDAAIQLLRDKLRQQQEAGAPNEKLYSTHANLGTFLILGPFRKVRPGNEQDKEILREGLEHIRTAIKIKPDSHFGREIWQAVIIEYMIALYSKPELLLEYDMIGNRLNREVDDGRRTPMNDFGNKPGQDYGGALQWGMDNGGIALSRRAAHYLEQPESYDETTGSDSKYAPPLNVRMGIARVGGEGGWTWNAAVKSAHEKPVPFDEPTLGIIGMWRLGGGAHPYFAVCLGETMLRVGQRYLAWEAFERAARMANFTWPDPALQQRFADHCRRRQAEIEAKLPADEVARLRPGFEAELALGQDYQKAYQLHEEQDIAAGKSIEDPHFDDDFHAQHPHIATPVGDADWFEYKDTLPPYEILHRKLVYIIEMASLLAGIFAMIVALWPSRKAAPVNSPSTN